MVEGGVKGQGKMVISLTPRNAVLFFIMTDK